MLRSPIRLTRCTVAPVRCTLWPTTSVRSASVTSPTTPWICGHSPWWIPKGMPRRCHITHCIHYPHYIYYIHCRQLHILHILHILHTPLTLHALCLASTYEPLFRDWVTRYFPHTRVLLGTARRAKLGERGAGMVVCPLPGIAAE